MAKMVVKYVVTPLPKGGSGEAAGGFVDVNTNTKSPLPPFRKGGCTFTDLNKAPTDLQPYIIQACELGLMGYYSDGETVKETFSPNGTLTRAEVAVVLSRMLRGNANKGSEKRWYHNHLLALKKNDIIQQDIDPMTLETRINVLLMLRRI
jgi:hypothetical protein